MYQPKSEATRAAHERLMSVLRSCLGAVEPPPDFVLLHVADDVLSVLKDVRIRKFQKKLMVERHVPGPIPASVFEDLLTICDSITDYVVVYPPNDEDHASDEESDSDEDREFLEDDDGYYSDVPEVNVEEMDADWLQRQISQAYGGNIEPGRCKALAERTLVILASDYKLDSEDELIRLFGFDKFSLIKLLLTYRDEVVTRCTPPPSD